MTDALPLLEQPHRRYDPLADEWLLVSPGRARRPWLGSREATATAGSPAYDPACPLCPGNERATGARNPPYTSTHVFTNDFAALRPDSTGEPFERGLFIAEPERGECRVICFSPRHDLALGELPPEAVRRVIDVWADQSAELGSRWPWVQLFENRGAAMGASNPHPHGQVWAGTAIPSQGRREAATQARHVERHGRPLLLEYATAEADGPRVVEANAEWLVVVPFWAGWPYESLLIPRRPAARLPDLDDAARSGLVAALDGLLGRYDGLFGEAFPYSMGWHQAPFDADGDTGWQLHAHAYPPLLRAGVRKFMVGYELLSEPQRDFTPEDAAAQLRMVEPGSARSDAR